MFHYAKLNTFLLKKKKNSCDYELIVLAISLFPFSMPIKIGLSENVLFSLSNIKYVFKYDHVRKMLKDVYNLLLHE